MEFVNLYDSLFKNIAHSMVLKMVHFRAIIVFMNSRCKIL